MAGGVMARHVVLRRFAAKDFATVNLSGVPRCRRGGLEKEPVMAVSLKLVPLSDAVAAAIRSGSIDYWTEIGNCDGLGEVPGDLVDETGVLVTDLLSTGQISDIYEASRITAMFECKRRLRS